MSMFVPAAFRAVPALQALRWAGAASASAQQQLGQLQNYATSAAERCKPSNVPEGHSKSDLSKQVCNISLGRRRDLTLRQDLCLWYDGGKKTLAEVLKGRKVIVVGFPGGSICTEKQLPGYVEMADLLHKKGVDKVLAVTVDEPSAVKDLCERANLKCSKLELLADRNGGFMRLLGLELAVPESGESGPKCQRFGAIVEDGILIKLQIEKTPKELQVSDAGSMLRLWQSVYEH